MPLYNEMLCDLYYFSELPVMQNKLGINIPFWIKVHVGIDTVAAISLTSEVMDKRKIVVLDTYEPM